MRAGFKGAVINGHNRGRYLDDKFYAPILECAQSSDVPIYMHPTPPPSRCSTSITAASTPMLTEMLAGGAWGWHIETAVHVIRLISGGVFDRFPKLQVVIGHMGEGLPFMFQRFDIMPPAVTKLKRQSGTICATTCTTRSRASIFRRPSSICSSNSAASIG